MALKILYADILGIEADTRVCTINLVGAMGAGVAKRFRDSVPGLYKHYRKMYPKITPHQFIVFKHGLELHLLVPTKIDWRDPSPRELVIANLEKLAAISRDNPAFGTIALPPFGCGHGHLDWEGDIRAVYERLFTDHPRLFIVTLGRKP